MITVFGAEMIASLKSCQEFVLGREIWLNIEYRRKRRRRRRSRKRRRRRKTHWDSLI